MAKYIVKNCPCFQWSKCDWQEAKHECCSKNTDCPIKKVVYLVMADNEIYKFIGRKEPVLNRQILQTLGVEGVE